MTQNRRQGVKLKMEFEIGKVYRRTDIHDKYRGQAQGGISTPREHPVIFLFTGSSGEQYGYKDGWDHGIFQYTGEGQKDDMKFIKYNKAVRDHKKNGKALLLFETLGKGEVRFVGSFECVGYEVKQGPDKEGRMRDLIVFQLKPVESELSS